MFSKTFCPGFYMYIEASNPRSKGHKAWLKSAEYTPSLGRCLSFWYHMYGTHIHTLNVLMYQNGSRSAPIWSLSGNQGYYWRPSRVTFRSSVRHSVSILNFGFELLFNFDILNICVVTHLVFQFEVGCCNNSNIVNLFFLQNL